MLDDIAEYIKKRLKDKAKPEIIKIDLLEKGFLESDVDRLIKDATGKSTKSYTIHKFVLRELFFKLSSGLGNEQFLYIFLFLLSGSYFVLGIGVGLSMMLSLLFSLFVYDYFKAKKITKALAGFTGLLMCICFILAAAGIYLSMAYLVMAAVVLLSLGNVLLGELYNRAYEKEMEVRGESLLLSKLGGYSLIFAVIGLIIGAYYLDKSVLGYNYMLGAAAVCLLISALILQNLIEKKTQIGTGSVLIMFKERIVTIIHRTLFIMKNKVVRILALGGILTGLVQTVGNTYYGVFIYQHFTYSAFGGFLNVAMILTVPIITSLFSAIIARSLSRKYGNIPSLIFGTLLIAILPLTMWLKPNLMNISMAMVCGVIGGALVGLTTGLLLNNYLDNEHKHWYFQSSILFTALGYLIFVPITAYIAENVGSISKMVAGLQTLFALLAFVLIVLVVPMYFAIFWIEKRRVV